MRRGARYYIRVRVPLDLVDTLGRSEIWKSLGTSDHREAVRRYYPARTDLQQTFDQARRRRDANGRLSGDEALHIVRAWFCETDRQAANMDYSLLGDDVRAALGETEQDIHYLIEGADGESVQAAVDRVLIAAGWPARPYQVGSIFTGTQVADVDGAALAELSGLMRRALVELARRRRERLRGSPNGMSFDPLFAADAVQLVAGNGHDGSGLRLGELTERFFAEKAPAMSPKTLIEYRALIRTLKEVWGEDLPVRSVTRDHCRQIRDLFAALPANWTKRFPRMTTLAAAEHAKANQIAPMDPSTANKHIRRMSSVLRWAEQEQYVPRNVAIGLKVATPEIDARSARRPLSVEQLRRIFSTPLYTGCQDDQYGYMVPGPTVIRRGRFWVPLICVFAGLRMGEACQLAVNDVEIEHGLTVLQVRPDPDAGTRLKTKNARRTVPLHEELIRIGLLDHVEQMRAAGHDRLFPELPRDRRGSYAGHFQRWANRFLEHAGAKGDRQSFHSTRHTFVDALRRAGAHGETIDDLLGWSRGEMKGRYGSGPWIMMLAEVMQRVDYPGLDLSHLYPS
jgi:integrase